MKTNAMSRIYAFAMSAIFATIATAGVAVLMSASGEQGRTEFNGSAAAQQGIQPATATLTLWQAPAGQAKQTL